MADSDASQGVSEAIATMAVSMATLERELVSSEHESVDQGQHAGSSGAQGAVDTTPSDRQAEEDGPQLMVSVALAVTGEPLCSLRLRAAEDITSLCNALFRLGGACFDLVFQGRVLRPGETLTDAGLFDGAVIQLVRRQPGPDWRFREQFRSMIAQRLGLIDAALREAMPDHYED
mmetsp:Transcript_103869/g.260506  ORF Transcript_103869/g.260506 Transcript_103869/m.260506 type:complete len:175 (-) Transcript_103869:491-1015(-)